MAQLVRALPSGLCCSERPGFELCTDQNLILSIYSPDMPLAHGYGENKLKLVGHIFVKNSNKLLLTLNERPLLHSSTRSKNEIEVKFISKWTSNDENILTGLPFSSRNAIMDIPQI